MGGDTQTLAEVMPFLLAGGKVWHHRGEYRCVQRCSDDLAFERRATPQDPFFPCAALPRSGYTIVEPAAPLPPKPEGPPIRIIREGPGGPLRPGEIAWIPEVGEGSLAPLVVIVVGLLAAGVLGAWLAGGI